MKIGSCRLAEYKNGGKEETMRAKEEKILETIDDSTLFIYPGFKFRVVDKLITNFHLPKSTLIMLTSAFAGKDFVFVEPYYDYVEVDKNPLKIDGYYFNVHYILYVFE